MAREITIEVGQFNALMHERLTDVLGEQYVAALRRETEDTIHDMFREVEQRQEAAAVDEEPNLEDAVAPSDEDE